MITIIFHTVHPDYVDWILEDMVPHPGQYYYDDQTAVRRASHESSDFKVADWFVKPPKYDPDSPLSPPFDQFDFCGYGNREKSYFLSFTLPREILYATWCIHIRIFPMKIYFLKLSLKNYAFVLQNFKALLRSIKPLGYF